MIGLLREVAHECPPGDSSLPLATVLDPGFAPAASLRLADEDSEWGDEVEWRRFVPSPGPCPIGWERGDKRWGRAPRAVPRTLKPKRGPALGWYAKPRWVFFGCPRL